MLLEQLDRYKLDITAIQEMRLIGEGVIEKKDHTVFYICQRRDHIFGRGFIINKRIEHLIMVFKRNHPECIDYKSGNFFFNYSIMCTCLN
jgi:hypothetical protein